MSLQGSIKENIDELIYEAIETILGKKDKIPNEFSTCNHLNVNTDKDADFIECRIRYLLENGKLKNKPKNVVNSFFKIYSTDPAILNIPISPTNQMKTSEMTPSAHNQTRTSSKL